MLDLRLPIGYFFIINAVILIGVGLFQAQSSTVPLGDGTINLNLIWGILMGAFGVFMAGLSYMEKMSKAKQAGSPAPPESK